MEIIKEYCAKKKLEYKNIAKDIDKKLAIIKVGNNQASERYVRNKLKDCAEAGIKSELIAYPNDIEANIVYNKINELNNNDSVGGFIVQLPLPKQLNEDKIKAMIKPEKDIDGFSPDTKVLAATPNGIYTYLKDQGFEFANKIAIVIGRSKIVGLPMAKKLLAENMTVIQMHSHTTETQKQELIPLADLIVVATGHRHTLTDKYKYKPTAIIMDVGINFNEEGKLCGDCDKNLPVAFQSPVPSGCGLLTRLSLMDNFIKLNTK